MDIWDIALLAGLLAGYPVLRSAFRLPATGAPAPVRLLWPRYLVTAYVALIAAQLFSYVFDAGTTLRPPQPIGWAYYYFSPTAGPKTLYGAALALPLAVFLISTPCRDLHYRDAIARWTPALFSVLAVARVGCFLQGCCYGIRSDVFGLSFPRGSIVYASQLERGMIHAGAPGLAVIPVQLLEALATATLAFWSYRRLKLGESGIFFDALAVYSICRFFGEFIRDDPVRNQLGPFSTSQWIALSVLVAYAAYRLRLANRA